jgi:hypothetical protein
MKDKQHWRELCEQAAFEQDPDKLLDLEEKGWIAEKFSGDVQVKSVQRIYTVKYF